MNREQNIAGIFTTIEARNAAVREDCPLPQNFVGVFAKVSQIVLVVAGRLLEQDARSFSCSNSIFISGFYPELGCIHNQVTVHPSHLTGSKPS